MKKKLSLLLPLLLLASCSSKGPEATEPAKDIESVNTETTSEKEENLETPLITDPLPTEESTEETEEIETEPQDEDVIREGTYVLTKENIEATQQSTYLNDYDFSIDDTLHFHGEYLQRGTGSHEGTIQMKKGVSYFYSLEKIKGAITFRIKQNGDYTAVPSLYTGQEENPTEKVEFEKVTQDADSIIYSKMLNGEYFCFKDESNYALYLYSMTVDCSLSSLG
ncbi:MAG: hypothetical protein SOW65_01310 [Candidatus Enterosoma sp.]|nr:hypothetical protein [bacterium]MDD7707759.1 hypothetical protein [bacterium]MDY3210473.1 hypothetical protein [Candidatus Enterosoma sp.]